MTCGCWFAIECPFINFTYIRLRRMSKVAGIGVPGRSSTRASSVSYEAGRWCRIPFGIGSFHHLCAASSGSLPARMAFEVYRLPPARVRRLAKAGPTSRKRYRPRASRNLSVADAMNASDLDAAGEHQSFPFLRERISKRNDPRPIGKESTWRSVCLPPPECADWICSHTRSEDPQPGTVRVQPPR